MSDTSIDTDRVISMESGLVPQQAERHAETRELDMNELDEANGGFLMLMAFLAGYGVGSMYRDIRGR